MRRRHLRLLAPVLLTALSLAGCDNSFQSNARVQLASASGTPSDAAPTPPDVMHLLRLEGLVSPGNVAANGTCIPFDASGRSRLIYLMLPAESSYVRLTVVARPGGSADMVDLVRGIPDGRIWSATLEGPRGTTTARLFASANDKAPTTDEWSAQDQRTQRLSEVAAAAIQSPCVPK